MIKRISHQYGFTFLRQLAGLLCVRLVEWRGTKMEAKTQLYSPGVFIHWWKQSCAATCTVQAWQNYSG